MLTRFDHAVVAVRDVEAARAIWRGSLGLDAQPGGRHTGRGTENAIVRFGLDYIELISIYDIAEVEARRDPNALALARRIEAGQGGLLGFALASDDLPADVSRFQQAGLAVTGPAPMERLRPDGRRLRWRLAVPEGGAWGTPLPFFIQWDVADAERLNWEPPGRHAIGARAIVALAVAVDKLSPWVSRYAEQVGLVLVDRGPVAELGADRARFRIGRTWIELLAPSGPGPLTDGLPAGGPQPWQLTVAVQSLSSAAHVLALHGVELQRAPGTPAGLLIPPQHALGARIVLVEAAPVQC
jgi:catechol 2,3-dioxygenase-like lactoylglutathione lyase family enzyme